MIHNQKVKELEDLISNFFEVEDLDFHNRKELSKQLDNYIDNLMS